RQPGYRPWTSRSSSRRARRQGRLDWRRYSHLHRGQNHRVIRSPATSRLLPRDGTNRDPDLAAWHFLATCRPDCCPDSCRHLPAPHLRKPVRHDGGGTKRQINFMVSRTNRIHACISASFDGLRGKFGGTGAVPCLVVTIKVGRSVSASAELAYATRSTTAQSVPLQHSIGYQSWLAEGMADMPASTSAEPTRARHLTRFRRIDLLSHFNGATEQAR